MMLAQLQHQRNLVKRFTRLSSQFQRPARPSEARTLRCRVELPCDSRADECTCSPPYPRLQHRSFHRDWELPPHAAGLRPDLPHARNEAAQHTGVGPFGSVWPIPRARRFESKARSGAESLASAAQEDCDGQANLASFARRSGLHPPGPCKHLIRRPVEVNVIDISGLDDPSGRFARYRNGPQLGLLLGQPHPAGEVSGNLRFRLFLIVL